MGKVTIGIDLGTTYSCVGIFRGDRLEIIPNEQGDNTTPSCVAFGDNGRLIGASAKAQATLNSANTIFDVKRLIGRSYDDPVVQHEKKRLPFSIVKIFGRPAIQVQFKGENLMFTPEEISAMVLGKLKAMVEHHLGLPSGSAIDCVVTVPSTFDIYQRQATKNACAIAGLNAIRIISEPTAAAFAYDLIRGTEEKCLCVVFDIGGGTLGVTLLELLNHISEVLATAGDDHLGGEDFDHRLTNFLAKVFVEQNHTKLNDLTSDTKAMARLKLAAERAKRTLSSSMETAIELESLHGNIDFCTTISRSQFEECCQDLFQKIPYVLDELFSRVFSYESASKVQEIVLVGGSTRIPKIQQIVSEYFDGKTLNRSINPDEAATFGASIQAANLAGELRSTVIREKLLIDATSQTIHTDRRSISAQHDVTTGTCLLRKGTGIPIIKREDFTTDMDGQSTLKLNIYEGDNDSLQDNLFLCDLELSGIPPAPKGVPEIELITEIDHDYILCVTLRDKGTGMKTAKKVVNRCINHLSQEQLNALQLRAENLRKDDEVDTARRVKKSSLESKAYALEDLLANLRLAESISPYFEEQARSMITATISWLEQNPYAPLHEYQQRIGTIEEISTVASRISADHISAMANEDVKLAAQRAETEAAQAYERELQHQSDPVHRKYVSEDNGLQQEVFEPLRRRENTRTPTPADHAQEPGKQPVIIPDAGISSFLATLTPAISLDVKLGQFFSMNPQPRLKYSDQDMKDIALLLGNSGRQQWSTVPRIYTVLRRIDELKLLDDFIELGISDVWFPFTANSLPEKLSPSARSSFINSQHLILTAALELETGKERRHAHFGKGDPIPYEVIARLGKGGYGNVDKVVSLISHKEYARKTFRRNRVFSRAREDIKSFKTELQILKRIKHDHCVELVGSYTDPKFLAIIMSPVADCNLAEYLIQVATSDDKISLLRSFYGCLANALQYLHNERIRHRDIKPENILIKGSSILLTDFGLSFDWEDLSRSTTTADVAKTPVYAAPEVAWFEKKKNSASDIWSLGCVFLEMATVLKGKTVLEMREFFKLRNDNYRYYNNIEAAKDWTRQLAQVGSKEDAIPIRWVAKMLHIDPDKRMTAAEVFSEIVLCESSVKFCGPCCHIEDDTDDTDDIDEYDPWRDTIQETIVA